MKIGIISHLTEISTNLMLKDFFIKKKVETKNIRQVILSVAKEKFPQDSVHHIVDYILMLQR